jgi:antitoxin component of MazEF toxin-antitoxin module
MSYFIELEENADGDLIMQIPEEVMETLDWQEGQLLTWDLKGNGIIVSALDDTLGYEQVE